MSSKAKVRSQKLPFVFSNFAMTADGKIAFADHRFVPFGTDYDREHMMELRASADAVMSGARTVEPEGLTLGPGGEKYRRLRLQRGLSEYNLRVIVSGSGTVDPTADIFKHRHSPIIVVTTERISKHHLKKLRTVAHVETFGETEINFKAALAWLRSKWNVKRLLCEGGGELHEGLIRAGLIDEIHLTFCPKIFGGKTAPTLADGGGFSHLAEAAQFKLKKISEKNGELFTVFQRLKMAK